MRNCKISLIVPVYNGAQYITQLYSNLSDQRFKDFEVVFVNDGSVDQSEDLILSNPYQLKITYLSQSNKGVSAARNLGITHSTGDYIAFCDVDDILSNDYLHALYDVLMKTNSEVSVCHLKALSPGDTEYANTTWNKTFYTADNIEYLSKYVYLKYLPVHCLMLISKKLLNEKHIQFKEGYKYGEDFTFAMQVLMNANKIVHIEQDLYGYIWHSNSAMTRFTEDRFDDYKLANYLVDYAREIDHPLFPELNKFWAARSLWSIARQSACRFSFNEFKVFLDEFDVNEEMLKLASYPDLKVSISSKIYLSSPYSFYLLSRIFKFLSR